MSERQMPFPTSNEWRNPVNSSVEILEPTKVKLTIEVPFEEFKPAIERSAKEIAKQVNIPGFRKGRIPARVLEAQIGRGAIVEDAVNNSLDGYYSDAIAANDWSIARDAADYLGADIPEDEDDSGPVGDLDILADVGVSELDLEALASDLDADSDELVERLAKRLGYAAVFKKAAAAFDV